LLAKAVVLSANEASRTEQEQVLQKLLRADKRCTFAYSSLRGLLAEDALLDLILFKTAIWTTHFELLGLELLRLGPHAITNQPLRAEINQVTLTIREKSSLSATRTLSPSELESELARRLTPEERTPIVNPVDVTPELIPPEFGRLLFACAAQRE
jgi:hypothetical protein